MSETKSEQIPSLKPQKIKRNQCDCGDPEPHSDHCGCCGNPGNFPNEAFCQKCRAHLGPAHLAVWDRTYFAQHGKPCPFEGIVIPEHNEGVAVEIVEI